MCLLPPKIIAPGTGLFKGFRQSVACFHFAQFVNNIAFVRTAVTGRLISVFQPGEGGIIAKAMDFGDHGAHGIKTHTARHLIILENDLVARLVTCFTGFFNRDDFDPDPKPLALIAHARFPFAPVNPMLYIFDACLLLAIWRSDICCCHFFDKFCNFCPSFGRHPLAYGGNGDRGENFLF